MINDNIQELLDGMLTDEQSAELLHLLSVNPERRADFHRQIALQEAMRRDRVASALSSSEDSEIWGVLAGLGGAAATTDAGSSAFGWMAKTAAVVVVGIVGYLLGSSSSTNIFTGRSDGNGTGAGVIRQSVPAQTAPPTIAGIPADLSGRGTPSATTPPAVKSDGAPNVIYRDRIIYKYAPAASASNIANDGRSARRNNGTIPPSIDPAANNGGGNNGLNGSAILPQTSIPTAPEVRPTTPSLAPATTPNGNEAKDGKGNVATLDPNSVLGHESLRSSSNQPSAPNAEPATASFLRDGFEVGLSDHEGLISPMPAGEESDPGFSNRNIDLSYRILDGQFGLGARFGYGSFAMVTLGSTLRARNNARGELASVETVLYPVLRPQKQFLTEFFLDYRLPIGGRFALGLESSLGVSAKHTKAGGDASLLWYFSDHIGMHAGAGLGYYWYDLTAANEDAIRNSPDNTSVVEMSDAYRGTVFEIKYGIFYHF